MRQLQILLLIFIAVFCLSACGNIPGSGEKIAYINWEEAVKAHPRHEALKQGQAEYDKLLAYRDQQADIAHKQISGLALLQKIKQNSKSSYYEADYRTSLYAKQAEEQHEFKAVLQKGADEADEILASERESIENDYQLRLFNLRLRLDTVRMKPEDRKQVEAELKSVRTEMLDKLEEVNRRRNEIIAGKTAPAREAMQQRIAEYAAGLRSELHGKLRDDIAKDDKDLQQGPEAFSKVLAVIDGRLDKIKEGNDKIASEISHDIENRVTRLAKERGYTIVFNKVKVNVKADDITAEVIKELKKSK